jgi:hypothetical protein
MKPHAKQATGCAVGRCVVLERYQRWFVAHPRSLEVEGPFETFAEAQAHVAANDNGRKR